MKVLLKVYICVMPNSIEMRNVMNQYLSHYKFCYLHKRGKRIFPTPFVAFPFISCILIKMQGFKHPQKKKNERAGRITTRKEKNQSSPVTRFKIILSYLKSQILFFFPPYIVTPIHNNRRKKAQLLYNTGHGFPETRQQLLRNAMENINYRVTCYLH